MTISLVNLKDSEIIWQKMLMHIYLDIFESLSLQRLYMYISCGYLNIYQDL